MVCGICYITKSKLKLLMSLEQGLENKKTSNLCSECATFYGSEAYNGLCSSCYKKVTQTKKEEIIEKSPAQTATPISVVEKQVVETMEQLTLEPSKKVQKDRKRCFDCNKKVGLLGIQCRCGYVFCNGHRLPEDHKCDFDHKQLAKQKLKKQIVKVCNGKINDF